MPAAPPRKPSSTGFRRCSSRSSPTRSLRASSPGPTRSASPSETSPSTFTTASSQWSRHCAALSPPAPCRAPMATGLILRYRSSPTSPPSPKHCSTTRSLTACATSLPAPAMFSTTPSPDSRRSSPSSAAYSAVLSPARNPSSTCSARCSARMVLSAGLPPCRLSARWSPNSPAPTRAATPPSTSPASATGPPTCSPPVAQSRPPTCSVRCPRRSLPPSR